MAIPRHDCHAPLVWVACLNLVLGLLTPPVGIGLYIAASMSDTKPGTILKTLWPFLIAVALVLTLLSYFPALSTFLIQ
ncbi:TRAP transporter large permease subunit [Cognatiyoonia sediminum]|uniref:TRAP transporter large permease subunit n=1 Tax=Cognatiyoonia sediminum TaxID=1508389 RepID=UPI000932645B|nr:TRAP transporter large permease subunit [Cognatiyoonia sediminum]